MTKLDNLDKLFVVWAFLFQVALIVHFALRKPFFESYTLRYGWIIYALCIPALIISIILLRGGKSWAFWTSGFLFVIYAAFGYWVDYIAKIQFRSPLNLPVVIPYVTLYLATVMFYWWPLLRLSRPLWGAYTVLYVIATVLNIQSH
jgi:hypothetical protein